MNHPEREEWVPYLYGEVAPSARRQLQTHLETCAECREEVAHWRRSLGRLDAWRLPRSRKAAERFVPLLKWAAATIVVVAFGFGVGRISAAGSVAAKERAALTLQVKQELRQELAQLARDEVSRATPATLVAARAEANKLLAAFTANLATQREAENQALQTALERLELQNLSLKKELDTVAVNTDAGLLQTEQQLAQFAIYKKPANTSAEQK